MFLVISGELNVSGLKYTSGDDHIYHVHEVNLDFKANEIYLVGETKYNEEQEDGMAGEPGVEYIMANRFIKNLNILSRKTKDPILIHMKTCGGDWSEGMAIYDTIKICPNYVTILNYTHARSMSSLIFLAADRRVMMPHSTYMFHEGTFATSGTVKQSVTDFEELRKANNIMIDIYVEHLKTSEHGSKRKFSKKVIRKWIEERINKKEDVYFDAKEAVRLGFADEIFDGVISTVAELPEK